ncbi:hypothetical protein [Sphingomonas sp. 32-62-10]|uniref:hypothetical protein n=1 Tax=Sphingomonas sp. 32-62-10 TaxID=1970436 RepID=UPI0026CD0478
MTNAVAVGKVEMPHQAMSSSAAILIFFALTFVWTWSLWWLASLTKSGWPGLSSVLFLASAFGPGLAAILTALMFEGVPGLRRWIKTCLNWRLGWRWYALAMLVPPLIMGTALAVQWSIGVRSSRSS